MWNNIQPILGDVSSVATVLAFLISLCVVAFSSYRYVSVRKRELQNERYDNYHSLLRKVSTGHDAEGLLKLVSQRACIYELRHFPEYKLLTIRLLESLAEEWKAKDDESDKNQKLFVEIADTLAALQKH